MSEEITPVNEPTKELSNTIFEIKGNQFQKAINNFTSGKTPSSVIRQKPAKGGGVENFVNIYWMTEQVGLLTGFRWSFECLEEKFLPDTDKPREVGAKIRVTIWDKDNRSYQYTSWGQKTIGYTKKDNIPLSLFDDLKSAYSDGIKKCLSYFGIARDVYGGKELEFFAEEGSTDPNPNKGMDELDRYITKCKLSYDRVFDILNIKSLDEITDYKAAYEKIKASVEVQK